MNKVFMLLAITFVGCTHSDQWHIVRMQNLRLYYIKSHSDACSSTPPKAGVDCKTGLKALEQWEIDGQRANFANHIACPTKSIDICTTHGLMKMQLHALDLDMKAVKAAGVE